MSPDLLLDMNKAIERGKTDIVFFAWYFLGLKLHPGQIRIIRNATGMVNVIVSGNRFGKTVLIAVRHIWFCFYKIGWDASSGEAWSKVRYRTVALAPDGKILSLDFDTIMAIMTSRFVISPKGSPVVTNKCRLGWWIETDRCRTTPNPFISFQDSTGILFYSTSDDKGTKAQGDFFGYGSYDEGGRSHWLQLELEQNLGPRFSELNAPMDLVSTPAVDSPSLGYHYDIFQKGLRGEDGFKSFEGSAYENVYLPKHYFEREEERLRGNPIIEQVLNGKFVFAGSALYPLDEIQAAKDASLDASVGYQDGHKYVVGIDTALGDDEFVITVLDVTEAPYRVVRLLGAKGASKSQDVHLADLIGIVEHYRRGYNLKICLETWNGEAKSFYQLMPTWMQNITKCWGSFQPHKPSGRAHRAAQGNTAARKADILVALRKVLSRGDLKIPNDSELIKQLSVYREDDTRLQTDRVISLALACWLATDGKPKVTNITFESIYI